MKRFVLDVLRSPFSEKARDGRLDNQAITSSIASLEEALRHIPLQYETTSQAAEFAKVRARLEYLLAVRYVRESEVSRGLLRYPMEEGSFNSPTPYGREIVFTLNASNKRKIEELLAQLPDRK